MGVESAKRKNGTIISTDCTECGTGEPMCISNPFEHNKGFNTVNIKCK